MPPSHLALIFLASLVASSSPSIPSTLLLPSNLTLSDPPTINLTARMNQVSCRGDPDLRPLSDYTTCIPTLFRLYATPGGIHSSILWAPGDFKQWGPETDLGGCYVLVDSGGQTDVFPVEALLGPALWTLGKCFVGEVEGRNRLGKTRVGPKSSWWLSVVLETTGAVGRNVSVG